MKVLIWHPEIDATTRWQTAFGCAGHYVRRARTTDEALMWLRTEHFDLLVFDMPSKELSGHTVAFMAEFHQPHITSILITDQEVNADNDLFDRLSNLCAVLSDRTPQKDVVAIAEAQMMRYSQQTTPYMEAAEEAGGYEAAKAKRAYAVK